MRTPALASSSLVGRSDETAAFARLLNTIGIGPSALVLSGEPGIGKTALWWEGISRLHERDVTVLVHRADASEATLSFQGLADLLDGVRSETLRELPRPQARAIEIALLREEVDARAPPARVISTATLNVLRSLSASGPVVLAIDDLQWLDAPTARTLHFALRRLEHADRVALLVSLRSEPAPGREPPSSPLLSDLRDASVEFLSLGPLDVQAIDEILVDRLTLTLPRSTLKELHRVTAGNPLFALEMGRALVRSHGRQPGHPLPVSAGVRDLLRDRVEVLPADTKEALGFVAALSRPTVEILRAALGEPPHLDPAIDEGVLGDDLRFSHPLLGSVIYADCSPSRKRRIHRMLADVVEEPEERARHLALAATRPSRSVAEALDRAAESASRRAAPDAAATLLEMARALTPRSDVVERRRRATMAAEAHLVSADPDAARRLLRGELSSCPAGIDRARLLLLLASIESDLDGSEAMLREAKEQTDGDRVLLLRVELALSRRRFLEGDLHGAAQLAETAVEVSERDGDDAWISMALTNLELYRFLLGDGLSSERLARALDLERLAESHPIPASEGSVYDGAETWLGCELMWSGALDEARVRLEGARHRALELGDESSVFALLLHLTELECLAGNLERARLYAETHERESAIEGTQNQTGAYALALVSALEGHVDRARAYAEKGIRHSTQAGDVVFEAQCRRTGGFLELSAGNLAAARQHLERVARCVERLGVVDPCVFPFEPDFIEVLIADGEEQRAEHLIEELDELGRRLDRAWALGTAARCRALLLARRGQLPDALEAAEASLKRLSRLPSYHPLELGRTLLVLGGIRRRTRQKRASREASEEARRVFSEIGATLWAAKAEAELGRIGGRPPSPLELTGSERRVAELAAAGRTNREIAQMLFVSVRTVEATLTKVYRKTGVSSRRELATRGFGHGDPP